MGSAGKRHLLDMGNPKTVLVVDGMSIAYRSYFGIPGLKSKTAGTITSPIFGLMKRLHYELHTHRPSMVWVVFDGRCTWRKELYPLYKANRAKNRNMDAVEAVNTTMEMLVPLFKVVHPNIRFVKLKTFEGDDGVAFLTLGTHKNDNVIVVSDDSDMGQLLVLRKNVLLALTSSIMSPKELRNKYLGGTGNFIADYKAMKGDTSDNVKGIPALGDKKAALIQATYGSYRKFRDADSVDKTLDKFRTKAARQAYAVCRKVVDLGYAVETYGNDIKEQLGVTAKFNTDDSELVRQFQKLFKQAGIKSISAQELVKLFIGGR